MSGIVPDFEEISDSNRPSSDPEFDREVTLTGMGRNGGSHPEMPPPAMSAKDPTVEQQLSAAVLMVDQRMRLLEQQETARQFRELKSEIRRVDVEKAAQHKRELQEMLDKVNAWGAEMRARTPGPAWKSIVIGMIALGLLGLGGLGIFIYRGAHALEQIQQHQAERIQKQQEQQDR